MLASMLPTLGSAERVGVLYSVHGGATTWSDQASFDSAIQIFSYDENSVPWDMIWNSSVWPLFLNQSTAKFQGDKYAFEYPKIGGADPFDTHSEAQLEDMTAALDLYISYLPWLGIDADIEVFTDRMSWISSDPADLPNPRSIYNPQGIWSILNAPKMTYCGSATDGGPWPGCDPERFNVDGAVERMLANNVDRILVADMVMSGPRFFKTYDQIDDARQVVDAYNLANGTSVTLEWVNDPTDVMTESYPLDIIGNFNKRWTASAGAPTMDVPVSLAGRPNPFLDYNTAAVVSIGVHDKFRSDIPMSKQAVVLLNHHVRKHNQYFDPKIDDTLVLNQNIRDVLKNIYPTLDENKMYGAWFGYKIDNPESSQYERTRQMRGEALGDSFLYETNEVLPSGIDGYLYWDALEALKADGIEHIVVIFPQILADSVLNMVEVHNEIAKEIGFKSWLYWEDGDFDNYPNDGHPFADHWQPGAETMCRLPGSADQSVTEPCCFVMGGCPGSAQPYPPERQTGLLEAIDIDDPHLVYDIPEYGHLGYDPANGSPDPNAPVQDQYTGTWVMYTPANDHPLIGMQVALRVFQHLFSTP